MADKKLAPVCGLYCPDCPFFGKQCTGCGYVKGKPFWTAEMPGGVCPLHECCTTKKELEHCGHCSAFPCKTFQELRDPNLSDEEFDKALGDRKTALTKRAKIGTEAWLKEKDA